MRVWAYLAHTRVCFYFIKFCTAMHILIRFGWLLLLLVACTPQPQGPLPYYGLHDTDPNTGDTIYHKIRDFSFVDQDSQVVNNATFAGKVYIGDFFFTSCPTICPKVKKNMLRIYERYRNDDRVMLLSHTIDVKRDTVGRLKAYAHGLGVDDGTGRWRFVTGNKDDLYDISYDYISTALENPDAPGGFDHSGYLLLIDPNRHLRSFVDGTKEEEVDKFMKDIDRLLEELK